MLNILAWCFEKFEVTFKRWLLSHACQSNDHIGNKDMKSRRRRETEPERQKTEPEAKKIEALR